MRAHNDEVRLQALCGSNDLFVYGDRPFEEQSLHSYVFLLDFTLQV